MMLVFKKGIHLYINVKNFASIVKREEKNTNDVDHSLHALNVYFRCLELFANSLDAYIEKVTGSRLHLFIEGELAECESVEKLLKLCKYSVDLKEHLSSASKYKMISKFVIQMGACYGDCCYYTFSNKGYSEDSSIGYAANVGAKLQSCAFSDELNVPGDILMISKSMFEFDYEKGLESMLKYSLSSYYEININSLKIQLKKSLFDKADEEINNVLLKDISFDNFFKSFSFSDLSIKNCKKGNAIILMADIRKSTKLYDRAGMNLDEMTSKTERFMDYMYNSVKDFGGIHVQFQGDKEVAVFSADKSKNAILASLKIQEEIQQLGLTIGIGIEYGLIFASKIGVRNSKDNVILGESVLECEMIEDTKAGECYTVISSNVKKLLQLNDEHEILSIFSNEGYPKTKYTYNQYIEKCRKNDSNRSFHEKNYNGAWNEL